MKPFALALSVGALLCVGAVSSASDAGDAATEVLPLSGTWEFRLDQGRGSGEWKAISVPSQWEQQGFGTYYYGTQGRGKPDDDPVIPKETGTYQRTFEIPQGWKNRDVILVFEAAMTSRRWCDPDAMTSKWWSPRNPRTPA
jgi:beta-galactosidase/beta-glucuronidase